MRCVGALFLVLSLCLFASFGDITVEAQVQANLSYNSELHPNEVTVLKAMATKLDIEFWNFSLDPCSGQGNWNSSIGPIESILTCNCPINNLSNYCHVKSIKLKSLNLTGPLPEELVNLTSLTKIDFSRNTFNGTIPRSWVTLPLTTLGLLGNKIAGPIPEEIGRISTLNEVILDSNLFKGSVPSFLGNLLSLRRLLLSSNQFTGELPESLGNLTNLETFRIDGNAISGRIPSFFANWTKMKRLDMQGTSLQGPFPPGFTSLTNLSQLRVTDINISGPFPQWEQLKLIKYLILRNCQLSGPIPPFIGNMTKLTRLDLSFNNFTGLIPSSLKILKFNYLFLTNNMLSGPIPQWIFKSNHKVDLSYNSFTGTGSYQACQISNVNLVSSYSPSVKKLKPCLSRNQTCSGKSMNYELYINCGGEQETVNEKVYQSDKTAINAASIYTSSSDGKWALSSTGYFVGDSTSPYTATNESLILNTTNSQLYKSARLNPLSLKYYALCMQSGYYTVNLHFAEIMFSEFGFGSNGRRIFDVSIQGEKVLDNFDITKNAGGVRRGIVRSFTALVENTLEIHFQWLGKGTMTIPSRGVYGPLISAISITPNFRPQKGDSGGLSNLALVGIVVGSCTFVIMIISVLFISLKKKKKHAKSEELKALESMTGYFSLRQIKTATQNFAPENKIGEGGFGSVYKGTLTDGTLIAVKQLSSKSRQGNREFINEVGMISAFQHPNLVKLFGCCVEGDQLLVIYEYMENNSLARALFSPEEANLNLDWRKRSKICKEIARGLAYLHEESMIKIVHRDIKATNVLLDSDLNAKISDFGLAKLDEGEDTHISTRIAGTRGYMAPEYAMRGHLTDKADVYSFGVVVLEIVSGKCNTNFRPKEDTVYLLDMAYVLQEQGNILELVDSCMGTNYSKKEAFRMLNIALMCTNPSPSLRPKMSTVISMLEGKTPVSADPIKIKRTESEILRFKAFEYLSQDSQTFGVSTDPPWTNSTGSASTRKDETVVSSNSSTPLIDLG